MKAKIQEFLRLHHSQPFSTDFLHRHFDVAIGEVEQICDELIAEGAACRPLHTHYVEGVEVDWAAVHAARARSNFPSPLIYKRKRLDCSFDELDPKAV